MRKLKLQGLMQERYNYADTVYSEITIAETSVSN